MTEYTVIVDKSTVPVGTARQGPRPRSAEHTSTFEFDVVSNPEFLKEGAAIDDFLKPDRVVIGSGSERRAADAFMDELYEPFVRTGQPDHPHGRRVGRAHEVRRQRDARDAHLVHERDRQHLLARGRQHRLTCARASASDARIGSRFLFAGLGYGGSCFPKDVQGDRKDRRGGTATISRSSQAVEEVNEAPEGDSLLRHGQGTY